MRAWTKALLYLKRNRNAILTGFSLAGVALTAVESSKSAFKVADMDNPTIKDKVECYIPTVVVAGLTGGCIFKNYHLSKKQIAGLTATAIAANKKLADYKLKVKEELGEESIEKIEDAINAEIAEKAPIEDDQIEGCGPDLFFDEFTRRYFRSSKEDVANAQFMLNRYFVKHGFANLSVFYDYLGLITDAMTDSNGWNVFVGYEIDNYNWIDFVEYALTDKDGEVCNIIGYHNQPMPNYLRGIPD